MSDSVGLLRDQVAIVTGASQGIGRAIAERFAQAGAAVTVNYFQSADAAHAVVTAIQERGGRAIAVQADVRDPGAVQKMVAQTQDAFGRIDILVNNALHNYRFDPANNPRFEEMSWSQFQDQIDGTVAGAMNTIQACLPALRAAGGGAVVNILTNLITNPVVQYHAYTTAKAAMIGMSRNLAAELGPDNIRVNMVAGGLIMTTQASAPTSEVVQDIVRSGTPLRRLGTTEDIADAILALASPLSRFVTGQFIAVDGGLTMP
ncbi:MAG: 3-oxoacyl-ACP reductase [Myxococcota bacterium]